MLNSKIRLFLPYPLSVNNYYVHTRNGIYISKKGKEYREHCNEEIREQLGKFEIIETRIKLVVILYPPDKRSRDVDNPMKCLLDALTHDPKNSVLGIWSDDKIIDQLIIFRGKPVSKGMCELFINDADPIIDQRISEIVCQEFI